MVEAAAQTAILVGSQADGAKQEGQIVLLAGVEEARFKKPVFPGDQIRVHVRRIASKGAFEKWSAELSVDGTLVMSTVLSAMRTDRK
jgi:3-hydroxyacyl-[acyl-carrier-protein] dehydratase